MKKIRREYVIIAVFWILIGTAYYWWGIFGDAINQVNNEKREMAEWPEFSIETISDYPKAVEDYINDHLPFRNQLIQLNSAIDYFIFHSSQSDCVIVGKDNWLFYADKDDGDPISNIKGRKLLTEEQLEAIGYNMVITRDRLAEQSIEFVIFIAPNKERVQRTIAVRIWRPRCRISGAADCELSAGQYRHQDRVSGERDR